MRLRSLDRFFAAVTDEALCACLAARGWTTRDPVGKFRVWENASLDNCNVICEKPARYEGRIAGVVCALADAESIQPTATLYDLLPPGLREDFVRELLPQVTVAAIVRG